MADDDRIRRLEPLPEEQIEIQNLLHDPRQIPARGIIPLPIPQRGPFTDNFPQIVPRAPVVRRGIQDRPRGEPRLRRGRTPQIDRLNQEAREAEQDLRQRAREMQNIFAPGENNNPADHPQTPPSSDEEEEVLFDVQDIEDIQGNGFSRNEDIRRQLINNLLDERRLQRLQERQMSLRDYQLQSGVITSDEELEKAYKVLRILEDNFAGLNDRVGDCGELMDAFPNLPALENHIFRIERRIDELRDDIDNYTSRDR
jgi:hypothetical protein